MTKKFGMASLGALLASLVLVACGSSQGGDYGGKPPDYAKLLAGSPPTLAKLHSQGGQVLDGGLDAYNQRIRQLRGYPIVVNVWASWCGPCRYEFPALQQASAKFGKKIAFLGVDSEDSTDSATTFLGEYPVPYPSYSDPDKDIATDLKVTFGYPGTVFYDRHGKLVYLHPGPYSSEAAFQADIDRYAT